MDLARGPLRFNEEPRQGLVGRDGADAVEARIGRIAVVKRTCQPLPAVLVGLVEGYQLRHLLAPVLDARLTERLQEIEAAQDFRKPLHLLLIGWVDGEGTGSEAEAESDGSDRGFEAGSGAHARALGRPIV